MPDVRAAVRRFSVFRAVARGCEDGTHPVAGRRPGEGAKVGEAEGFDLHVALLLNCLARVRDFGLTGAVGAASSSSSGVFGAAR